MNLIQKEGRFVFDQSERRRTGFTRDISFRPMWLKACGVRFPLHQRVKLGFNEKVSERAMKGIAGKRLTHRTANYNATTGEPEKLDSIKGLATL